MKLIAFFSLAGIVFIKVVAARKGFGPGEQEWGFVDVRPGAHMFFWLYYTTAPVECFTNRPLIIWIQGGPSLSGTGLGNFGEIGPMDAKLKNREYTWVKDANVLFVDNPVGTGFSYVENNNYLCNSTEQIAVDLVTFLKRFMNFYPKFKSVPLYIIGQSYGGKMSTAFAYLLFQEIQKGNIEANFKGLGISAGWISPADTILNYAPYLLNIGAIDKKQYSKIYRIAVAVNSSSAAESFLDAWDGYFSVLSQIYKDTELISAYNVLYKQRHHGTYHVLDNSEINHLMDTSVKLQLGIFSNVSFQEQRSNVYEWLKGDIMKPVKNTVQKLLSEANIKVVVLTGQLDMIVNTPGTLQWIDSIEWTNKSDWYNAPRKSLVEDDIIEGYEKTYGKFSVFWVNRAGHLIPSDNPKAMSAILKKLTDNYTSDASLNNFIENEK